MNIIPIFDVNSQDSLGVMPYADSQGPSSMPFGLNTTNNNLGNQS